MEPIYARQTCYYDEPSMQACKTQGEGMTFSYLGPQNKIFITENPLDFSGSKAIKSCFNRPWKMAQKLYKSRSKMEETPPSQTRHKPTL